MPIATSTNYDRAIDDFSQAIRLDAKNAAAFDNRGLAYRMKGDLDRAIADFDQAVRLDPKSSAIFNDRGTTYGMRGDTDRAIQDLDAAIKLDPQKRGCVQQPRLCPPQQGRNRPRPRRFQRGDQDQSELRGRAL